MSMDMNSAPDVEMMLFNSSFTVSSSDVDVLQLSGQLIKYPPTVSLFWFLCSLFYWQSHTIWPYVTSLNRSCSTSCLLIKNILFFPSVLPSIPCANLPILFPNDSPQTCLYFGRLITWRYSIISTFSSSNTAFAYLHRNFRGCFLDSSPCAEIFVPLVSNVYSNISCVMVLVPPQDLFFCDILSYLYCFMLLSASDF